MGAEIIEDAENVAIEIPISKYEIEKLKELRVPAHMLSILSIVVDWALIVLGYVLVVYSIYFIPLTLLMIGSRQRAISNLSHDASHFNLFKNKTINDFITNIFCSLPMFETVAIYRKLHFKHHKFLGDPENDPDSKAHLLLGYDDTNPWRGSPFKNYIRLVLNQRSLASSFFGNIFNLSFKDSGYLLAWWVSVYVLIATLFNIKLTLLIFFVWFLSKATTFHLIRVFAEFLDHTGLEKDKEVYFTRNLPQNGLMRFIVHPNCDTYHIAHHLYPKVPHYNLKKADKVLKRQSDYFMSHHCDSYFFGKHSAASCWVGNCTRSRK